MNRRDLIRASRTAIDRLDRFCGDLPAAAEIAVALHRLTLAVLLLDRAADREAPSPEEEDR